MADPAIRGQRIVDELLPMILEDGMGIEVKYGFPSEATPGLHASAGMTYDTAGQLPQWVRWQNGRAVHEDAPRIPRPRGSGRSAHKPPRVGSRGRTSSVEEVDRVSFERWALHFDDSPERSSTIATAIHVRDGAHVRWRWLARPEGGWRVLVARATSADDSGIDGYLAFSVTGRRGHIGDLLAVTPEAQRASSGCAIRQLRGRAIARFSSCRIRGPVVPKVVRRAGFQARGQGPKVEMFAVAEWVPACVNELSSWYLTFGDTDHD